MSEDGSALLFAFVAPGCQGPSAYRPPPRQKFLDVNGTGKQGDLTLIEATAIADAIDAITTDNFYLRDHYYDWYSQGGLLDNYRIRRLSGKEDRDAIANNRGADTSGGVTTIPSDIQITAAQPPASKRAADGDIGPFLGTVMIHEYAHVGQTREFSVTGAYASEGEAIAYGVEYFFALRTGNSARAGIIMDERKPWFWDKGTWMFCKWFLMLKWSYEIADGKRSDAKPWEGAIAAHNVIRYGNPEDGWQDGTAKKAKAFAEDLLTNGQGWSSSGFPPGTVGPYGADKSAVLAKMQSICVL